MTNRQKDLHAEVPNRGDAEWLGVVDAAQYLRKTPRFMRRLVAERRITHFKHGRFVAFRKVDLDQWATSDRREAVR